MSLSSPKSSALQIFVEFGRHVRYIDRYFFRTHREGNIDPLEHACYAEELTDEFTVSLQYGNMLTSCTVCKSLELF